MDQRFSQIQPATIEKLRSGRLLITGASGLLGRQLVYELDRVGIRPVCLVRESSDITYLKSLDLEIRFADLRDSDALALAFAGIEWVIHTAALVDFRGDRLTMFTGLNSFGALASYRAAGSASAASATGATGATGSAGSAGVKRFAHISSVVGIGAVYRTGADIAPLTESAEFNLSHINVPYILSKRSAEDLLAAESEAGSETAGPELVTLNPSIVVAPSRHSSDRHRIDKLFGRKFIPTFPNHLNFVDLRDIAPAIINALVSGVPGKRYLLTGENLALTEILDIFQNLTGKTPRRVRIPRSALNLAAKFFSARHRRKSGGKLRLYPDLLKMLDYDWVYDSALAKSDLGFVSRPANETLGDLYRETFHGTFLDMK